MSFTLPSKVIVLACAACLSTFASGQTSGNSWMPFNTTANVSLAFGTLPMSFNVTKNSEICGNNLTFVEFNPNTTDYTPVINTALAQSVNGSVVLGAGNFTLRGPLFLPNGSCLVGNSTEMTILKLDNLASLTNSSRGLITSNMSTHVSVVNLTVNGNLVGQFQNDTGVSGLYFGLVNYVWLKDVHVVGHTKNGIEVRGMDDRRSTHVFLEETSTDGNMLAGVSFEGTTYASLYRSTSNRNGRAGLSVTGGSTSTLVRYNTFMNNRCGIDIHAVGTKYPYETVLEENNAANSAYAGLCISSAVDVTDSATYITNFEDEYASCYQLSDVRGFKVNNTICKTLSGTVFGTGAAKAIPQPKPTQSNSPTPSASPSPIAMWKAAVGCSDGIAEQDVCCPFECGTCGGSLCDVDQPSKVCCPRGIHSNEEKQFCKSAAPPCLLHSVGNLQTA